jgi:uncharacterized protein YvpB
MKKISSWEWALFLIPPVAILGGVLIFIFSYAYSSVSAGDVIAMFTSPFQEEINSLEGVPQATATLTPFQPLGANGDPATEAPSSTTPQPADTQTRTLTLTATTEPTSTQTPTATLTETSTETHTPETPTAVLSPTETPKPSKTPTRKPTRTPQPPRSASVGKVVGHAQMYSLDCESRSAVDFAGFFGVDIDEQEFLKKLPRSDNPEQGFVGRLTDPKGRIPPESYGVYARPVAALLNEYGLEARARKNFSWDRIKAEIAAGRPVIAWVIGNTIPGRRFSYTTPDGEKVIVAPFEHTVIVTGYNEDYVTILDENNTYQRAIEAFIESWGVLGNMAITSK